MKISFFRGDDHQVQFKLKNFTATIEKMFFTVKCKEKILRIQKKLNDGIEFDGEYYVISFVPEDTNNLGCYLKMVYDIQIEVGGKKITIIKDEFEILEDVTTPKEEV